MSNASTIIDFICERLVEFCTVSPAAGQDRLLVFDMGRAILRAAEKALLMRVEADDIVACHSIKAALEAHIFEVVGARQTALLWISGQEEPFVALANYAAVAGGEPVPDFRSMREGSQGKP